MANPRVLVRRRKSVQNTRKITKTMEMVSTAKLSKAQHAAISGRPYAAALRLVVEDLAAAVGGLSHPLLEARAPVRRAAVILLTSDRGLCGAFNSNIIREARRLWEELRKAGAEVDFILQGKKAAAAARSLGWKVARQYLQVSAKPSYARAEEIGNAVQERFTRRELDEVYVVYSAFRSSVSQSPVAEKILPLGGLSGRTDRADRAACLFHPSPQAILAEVLPLVMKTSLFRAMLETAAGEHAARRVAMKNATDAADEMIKLLTQSYNRARQSKITQEIAEIVGGVEAL